MQFGFHLAVEPALAQSRMIKLEDLENKGELSRSLPMKNLQSRTGAGRCYGMVNQQLLLQNEYLVAENRILRTHLPGRLRLTDPQRFPLPKSANSSAVQAL